jgi:hypothetical protein
MIDSINFIINDVYNFSDKYHLDDIHVAVFPLKTSSVVLMFVETGIKRYRKFIKQLKRLDENDQLAIINYLIFNYTENVFLNPSLRQDLKSNNNFMKVCRRTTIAYSAFGMTNPIEKAKQDFSFDGFRTIPNLLSSEYALLKSSHKVTE